MFRLLTIVALVCSFTFPIKGQCPSVSTVIPSSGLYNGIFKLIGLNLDQVNNITASSGSINTIGMNSSQINFTFQSSVSGSITLTLLPNNLNSCDTIKIIIDVKSVGWFWLYAKVICRHKSKRKLKRSGIRLGLNPQSSDVTLTIWAIGLLDGNGV